MFVYKIIRYRDKTIARRKICKVAGIDQSENTAARVLDDLYNDMYRGYELKSRSLVSSENLGCICNDKATFENNPFHKHEPVDRIEAEFEVWAWEIGMNGA